MYVAQTLSGYATVNCRASMFGATCKSWLLSMVTLNRRLPLARMPCSFMDFWTRALPTRMPLAWPTVLSRCAASRTLEGLQQHASS